MAQSISEKFSDNQCAPRRKRGRPRLQVLDPEFTRFCQLGGVFHGGKTRTDQNSMYRMRAIVILAQTERPEFKWLFDIDGMIADRPKSQKKTILAELGRIRNEIELIQAAFDICDLKPKTKDAISIIRQVRTGRECKGDVDQLTRLIARTVQEYLREHPGTTYTHAYHAIIPVVQRLADIAALDGPELDELIDQLRGNQ